MTPIALSIAGSDPSGGAGIQADLKTFYAHRVFGTAVLTLLTVQNTRGVRRVELVTPAFITEQIRALFDDVAPHAIKTGAIGGAAQVEAVSAALADYPAVPLVVDPVCLSKTRAELLDRAGRDALVRLLIPRATLVTPNLDEAELLLGRTVHTGPQIEAAAHAFLELGAQAVLLKGGHREGEPTDVLCTPHGLIELHGTRIQTRHTHGVGCSLSAAIAARLARGESLPDACALAKRWVASGIASAPGLGGGHGPMNHWAPLPDGSAG